MFRLINQLVQTVRNKHEPQQDNWDGEYYGANTKSAAERRYHPTHATPDALFIARPDRQSCRELKRELRAERRRRKAERVAARRARKACRCRGSPRRAWRDAEAAFPSETASSGPARTQQRPHEAGGHDHHTDSVPGARSEPVRLHSQYLPRQFGNGGHDVIDEAPPAYEKVERTDRF